MLALNKKKKTEPFQLIVYLLLFLIGMLFIAHLENASNIYFSAQSGEPNYIDAISVILDNASKNITKSPFEINATVTTLKWCGAYIFLVVFTIYYLKSIERKTAFGKEKGSAEWASIKDEKKYYDKKSSENNMILTNTVQMSMNTRQHRKNNNILIIGSTGAGKSRFFAKPNLMQANCSFVVTDPKGELLRDTADMFEKLGYEVKVFNLKEPEYSCCYNPFVYIRNDDEVFILVNQLIKNTTAKEKGGGDAFWEKAETTLIEALFFFLLHPISIDDYYEYTSTPSFQQILEANEMSIMEFNEAMKDVISFLEHIELKKNIGGIMDLLLFAEVREDNEAYKSTLDFLFEISKYKADKNNESCIAFKQYKIYKMAAGKTAKSILISVGVRLQAFNLPTMRNLTDIDTLELEKMGDRKTVLFAVLPDDDKTLNFLVAMMYNQLFRTLYYCADFGSQEVTEKNTIPKSKGSFDNKMELLLNCYEQLGNTVGDKAYKNLLKEAKKYENQLHQEFGVNVSCIKFSNMQDRKTAMKLAADDLMKNTSELKTALDDRVQYLNNIVHGEQSSEANIVKAIYGVSPKDKNYKETLRALARFIEWSDSHSFEHGSAEKLKELNLYFDEKKNKINALYEELNGFSRKQRNASEYIEKKNEFDETEKEISDIREVLKHEYGLNLPKISYGKETTEDNKWNDYNIALSDKLFEISGLSSTTGRLKIPVRFILDEFVNIGEIPDFEQKIATMRSREISVSIIIQTISSLKGIYKDHWETIAGNCDSWLFLGGTEEQTTEKLSKKLGTATIDVRNSSRSKGKSGSYSTSWQKDGRKLLEPDEVGMIPDSKCILFIRGNRPFYVDKYHIEKHKRYKMLADSNPTLKYPYRERFATANQVEKIKQSFENELEKKKQLDKEKKLENFRNNEAERISETVSELIAIKNEEQKSKLATETRLNKMISRFISKVNQKQPMSVCGDELYDYLSNELQSRYSLQLSSFSNDELLVEINNNVDEDNQLCFIDELDSDNQIEERVENTEIQVFEEPEDSDAEESDNSQFECNGQSNNVAEDESPETDLTEDILTNESYESEVLVIEDEMQNIDFDNIIED